MRKKYDEKMKKKKEDEEKLKRIKEEKSWLNAYYPTKEEACYMPRRCLLE